MTWNESDFDGCPPFDTSTDSADWFSNCDFFKYFPKEEPRKGVIKESKDLGNN